MKRSLTEIIDEDEFLIFLAQEHSWNFLKIYNFLHGDSYSCTRRFYSHLIEECEELESFLDDHCARDNKTWNFFGELVACIRNLSKVAFILKHVINRFPAYGFLDEESHEYFQRAGHVSAYIDKTIRQLFEEIKEESLALGMKFPRGNIKESFLTEVYPQKRLPYTLDDDGILNDEKIVAKIATQFIDSYERFKEFRWDTINNHSEKQNRLIPDMINEEKSRELIAVIHNLQSTYDHYIKRTHLESRDENLTQLRGTISIPLHLMNIVNWIAHLQQRHIRPVKADRDTKDISTIIDKSQMQDIMLNFAFFYTHKYMEKGKNVAAKILGEYTEIEVCEIKVPEKVGFHLRPAGMVAKLAKHHGTKLTLIVGDQEFDASSVLNITIAAGLLARRGDKTVIFKGDRLVLKDLRLLSKHHYGISEEGDNNLPPQLAHLLV